MCGKASLDSRLLSLWHWLMRESGPGLPQKDDTEYKNWGNTSKNSLSFYVRSSIHLAFLLH